MKKIFIIANDIGGLIRFRGMLISELMQKNDVFCVIPYNDEVNSLQEICTRTIDTPLDRRGINPLKDWNLFFQYVKILKRQKPDIVITYTIKPNIYAGFTCRMLGIPYVVNITGLGTAFQKEGMLKKIVSQMYKQACKNAKVVFFENEESRRIFIREKIAQESQTYRLNGAGVDLDRFYVTEYPKGEKTIFLFIGRVMAEKGINELFTAMKKLVKEGILCELQIVGAFEENYTRLIEKYKDEGWLTYYGVQKDVRPFIERSNCFVLPSWHEGMANTNLESAASGRPVITTNIPGCMEAVEDGISGYLCKKQDIEDLYSVMKKFTELPYAERKAMGLAGRKLMEDTFDKRKVVKETIEELMK